MIMSWARQASIIYDCTGKIPQLLLELGSPVIRTIEKALQCRMKLMSHIFRRKEAKTNSKIRSAQRADYYTIFNQYHPDDDDEV